MTTQQFDEVVAILHGWVIAEEYEYDICLQKLIAAGLPENEADMYMDIVNFKDIEKKGVARVINEHIEEQEQLAQEAEAEGQNYCGYDLIEW
jgi:hypothetical protein